MTTRCDSARAATAPSTCSRVSLLRGFLEVGVVGAERSLQLGVIEGEEGACAGAAGRGGTGAAVLLDRRLLKLGVALEAEGLGEAHHRR